MSGQPDTSDDLIAELAKLMATNAKPEPAPQPAAAAKPAFAPIPIRIPGSDLPPRIPGGDIPAAETRPPAPVVRIPGMDMPPPGAAANSPAPTPIPVPHTPSPAPLAQPFEPRIVSDHAIPQAPIHLVTETPVSPADPDPIAALIAAELETPAAAPTPGAAAAAPRPTQAPPPPARFSQQPRPVPTSSSAPRPMPLSLAGQPKAAPATPITLKPVHAPRQLPVESDTFGVAPTAGVARPAARQNDGDPMDEIESLIGEAVRVEMDRPAPVVTPVGGLAPRRTAPIEPKAESTTPRSADEAILAAAAATGANVDVIDRPAAATGRREEPAVVVPPGNRRPANIRQYVGMAVAGTLLLAAAFGLYWVLGMGRGDGTVPVLTADASPAKVVPDPATTASTDAATTTSPVLNELDGVDNTGSETLVSTDQSTDTDAVSEDEILDSGLANRKVRTVTVRPDGTIVTGEDAVAGSEALPDTRPNVPDVPGDASTATDVIADAAQGVAQDPIAAVIANPDAAPATTDLALVDPATTASPVATPVNLDPSIPIPLPPMQGRATEPMVAAAPLATDLPALDTATTTENQPLDLLSPDTVAEPVEAAPTQVAEAPPPTSTPGNPAPAYVQLSAQRDEATALADARRFTSQFTSVIGDTPLEVHIVDLGAKGTWYRVLLPASSSSAANTACSNIKAAGGDCLIR